AAGQGRARDRVIAALERAGSVDQQVDAGGREGCGEVRGIEVQALRAHRVGPGAAGVHEGAGTAQVAPGDQDLAAAIGRERAGDAAAEMTVAAEDKDAHGPMLAAPARPSHRCAAWPQSLVSIDNHPHLETIAGMAGHSYPRRFPCGWTS